VYVRPTGLRRTEYTDGSLLVESCGGLAIIRLKVDVMFSSSYTRHKESNNNDYTITKKTAISMMLMFDSIKSITYNDSSSQKKRSKSHRHSRGDAEGDEIERGYD
jgi:hypothetical protein